MQDMWASRQADKTDVRFDRALVNLSKPQGYHMYRKVQGGKI